MNSGSEKRLLPRLTVSHEVFRLDENGKLFAVADLSMKGMAIRIADRDDFFSFSVGAEVRGILNLRREKFPIQARVRHLGRELVGLEFETLPSSIEHALARLLDPATLGADLRPVPTEDGSILFAASSGTEVLFGQIGAGNFQRVTVMMLGTLVIWDAKSGLRTGTVTNSYEQSFVNGVTRMETLLFDEDRAIDPQKLNLAKAMISSSNLSEELKKFCARHLEGASA